MKKIFLSHTATDKPFVRQFATDLASFDIPCWVDEAEIAYGESLIKKIQQSIELVALVIVVISKKSMESEWVQTELEMALTLEIEGRKNFVVPIVIENVEVPLILRRKRYIVSTTPRGYKLNVGAFAEFLKTDNQAKYITSGQALEIIKSQCEFDGGIIALSQQGLTQIVGNQHFLLKNLIYRDANLGASRFWVFELFMQHLNIIRTITLTDGYLSKLPDRAIEGWASNAQFENVKFEITSYSKEGKEEKRTAYRTTNFKPEAVASNFTDSQIIYNKVQEQRKDTFATLLYGGFVTMTLEYKKEYKQFIWNIQFFDSFSMYPLYHFISDNSGNILHEGQNPKDGLINQEIIWFSFDESKNIRGKVALNLINYIMSRNK